MGKQNCIQSLDKIDLCIVSAHYFFEYIQSFLQITNVIFRKSKHNFTIIFEGRLIIQILYYRWCRRSMLPSKHLLFLENMSYFWHLIIENLAQVPLMEISLSWKNISFYILRLTSMLHWHLITDNFNLI